MYPSVIFPVLVLLPSVLCVNKTAIRDGIESYKLSAAESKAKAEEIKKKINGLDEVYKSAIGELPDLKNNISTEHLNSLKEYTVKVFKVRSWKNAKACELFEIDNLKASLTKLNLTLSWLTEDVNVFERRRKYGEEQQCQTLTTEEKIVQTSRYLVEEDEVRILREELKFAKLADLEAAEQVRVLERRLEVEENKMNAEVASATKIIRNRLTTLANLKSEHLEKAKKLDELKKEVSDLTAEKAQLLDSLRKKLGEFQLQVKALKGFYSAAQCYRDVIKTVNTVSPRPVLY